MRSVRIRLFSLLAACTPATALVVAAAAPAAEPPAGHQRMLTELAAIRDSESPRNPFFRRQSIESLRGAVAALDPGTGPQERLRLRLQLGLEEFRYGSVDSAISELGWAFERVPEEAAALRTQIAFHLALAHLRRGERRNCVANHTGESCILPIRGGGIHTAQTEARRAIELFDYVLDRAPEKSIEAVAVKWLLNLAAMAVGDYPGKVPPERRLPPALFAPEAPFPRFPNVAPARGVDVVDYAGGAVVDDLDGDGHLDILTSSWAPWTPLRLFRGSGSGAFEEATAAANLEGLTGGLNLVHADYDNDGDVDVLVLRGAWLGSDGELPNSLLDNDGKGRFTDRTFEAGLGEVYRPTQTAAWADYDNDGDLDLYIGNEGSESEYPAQLFRNNGNRTFTDIATQAGVENHRFAKGVAWGDYDGDRWPDLYVSNYWHPNRLYRNNGDGTFTDVAERLGVTRPEGGFASWFWDFDNDGALDLYAGSYPYKGDSGLVNLFAVVADALGIETLAEPARLYRGDGRGGFEEVGAARGLDRITMPMGANYGDLDNDGFPDVYLGTGYPEYDGLIPNLLFLNQGGSRFVDVTAAAGVGHLQKGHGVVFADLDGDGDQDLFEQVGGFYIDDSFANALFENPGFGRHWLEVRLIGAESNRGGVGATVRAEIVDGDTRRSVYRTISSGGSFGSNPLAAHLGLGAAGRVELLEIYWPTSDTTQVFREVAADQRIEVVEGEETYRVR